MNYINVQSSNIKSIGWKDRKLQVTFRNGVTYEYENVSETIYHIFVNDDKPGEFYRRSIQRKYKETKI